MEFMCDLRFPTFYGFQKEHRLGLFQVGAVETKVSFHLKNVICLFKSRPCEQREINIDFTDKVETNE